ncbi:hypothetical protein G7015_09420 [Pseudomonas kunmingensis]|uniref:hypothetical protein n=1 Tax=Stutzerimonas kunmingensis TaxID=1211807 RepID=UPI0015E3F1D6|nr:hypothetical protein [Stutzerimonas kunmingensis]MBA1238695.1 hypothetical protein [Stutzerimonas kunmingensis]
MAVLNSTETTVASGFEGSSESLLSIPELEKISCSIRGETSVHPLWLVGKHIRFAELILSDTEACVGDGDPLESHISSGRVLAASIGSIEHGVDSSLLIQQDGFEFSEYVDISSLTVLEVLH